MKTIRRNLDEVGGVELTSNQILALRGGAEALWVGDCAVHHAPNPGGPFWKLITWRWQGTGAEAEAACTDHYHTNEEAGSWCLCDYEV